MKKVLLSASVAALIMLYACSSGAKVETTAATTEAKIEETKVVETTVAEKKEEKKSVNHYTEREFSYDGSPFTYTGSDKYLKAITDDMVEFSKEAFGNQGAVEIPTPYIVKTDDSDKSDIKVYGDFWIYGYEMYGTIFNMKNGGSYPGCYHLKDENGNVTVVKKEFAEDGSNNWSSLVKICGGDENLAKEVSGAREKDDEKVRIEYAKMYAKSKNLKLSGIKDFGWPVILFDDIDDAVFVYNFYNSYFGEIRQEDLLKDMADRLTRLKERYFTKELLKKVADLTAENGADMVINAQDVTEEMLDSLEATNKGNGEVELTYGSGETKATAIIKLESKGGKKTITDITWQ